ncbi:IS3 family transposase [Priestia taiwanensis]|uniref:IS3 family transposase n=1 Tax=Priestia taiwanensis TaxID=1347902 RepID=UPI00166622E7
MARNVKFNKEIPLKAIIKSIHLKHKQYGYPRIKIALREKGLLFNHKKVYRLMRELSNQLFERGDASFKVSTQMFSKTFQTTISVIENITRLSLQILPTYR